MDRFERDALDRHITGNYGGGGIPDSKEDEEEALPALPRTAPGVRQRYQGEEVGGEFQLCKNCGQPYGHHEPKMDGYFCPRWPRFPHMIDQ